MTRLRRADCSGTGISRRRRGRGFEYLDEDGRRVEEPEVVERIRELAIPPAWEDVWICPYPNGHIQATGTDAAGRRQYLYHQRWRERRDQQKFNEMVEFARALPVMRRRVARHLRRDELDRTRVLACAVRLLDRGFFRVGGEEYAVENSSYGLATIRKQHVELENGELTFSYPAKGGQRRIHSVVDPRCHEVVTQLKRRRGGGPELLAYKQARRWHDVRSSDINDYVKEIGSESFSAKDFRTWNATVLAAAVLASADGGAETKTAREREIRRAIEVVAHYLGNTPAVCRASYIDPRVLDRYRAGVTIEAALPELDEDDVDIARLHGRVEEAVLDLLDG